MYVMSIVTGIRFRRHSSQRVRKHKVVIVTLKVQHKMLVYHSDQCAAWYCNSRLSKYPPQQLTLVFHPCTFSYTHIVNRGEKEANHTSLIIHMPFEPEVNDVSKLLTLINVLPHCKRNIRNSEFKCSKFNMICIALIRHVCQLLYSLTLLFYVLLATVDVYYPLLPP